MTARSHSPPHVLVTWLPFGFEECGTIKKATCHPQKKRPRKINVHLWLHSWRIMYKTTPLTPICCMNRLRFLSRDAGSPSDTGSSYSVASCLAELVFCPNRVARSFGKTEQCSPLGLKSGCKGSERWLERNRAFARRASLRNKWQK
jgi:hypothetical protein